MNLHQYQKLAIRTESIIDSVVADKAELLHTLAMFVTVGEMLDCLKKKIYYKNPKKYNEKFESLSNDLKFFTSCTDRHHTDLHEQELQGVNPRVFHGIIGVATEASELVSALQKNINGTELDPINIGEEMGDVNWYMAILHEALVLNPDKTLSVNIAKLAARYPEKYSDEAAENRNLDKEREILEGQNEV
jgi:NTP pyrophosphatase (non-canonical NTP hydrolase)